MPIDTPTYNRAADFLDTGYANIPPQQTPVAPTPPQPVDDKTMANYIFAPDPNLGDKYPFLNSIPYTNPIKTPLIGTERYNDPMYGYDPFNPNLEYQYGDRQSGWDKWKNNLLKFGANTIGALVETAAAIPMTISALAHGDISKSFNNDLTNSISDWMNNLETKLPNYTTTFEKNNPVLSYIPGFASLGTLGDSWGGVLKNTGFIAGSIAGSILQDAGVAVLTGGMGEAPLIAPQINRILGRFGKIFSTAGGAEKVASLMETGAPVLNETEAAGQVFNAGRATSQAEGLAHQQDLANAINKASEAKSLVNKFRYGTALTTSALSMGIISGNQTYNTIKQQLTQDFREKAGRDPNIEEQSQIEDYAKGGGNASLYANTALTALIGSNVFGSLFKPVEAAESAVQSSIIRDVPINLKEGSLDVFEQVQKNNKGFNLIQNKLTNATRTIKDLTSTSLLFGSQFAINRSAEDYYKRKFDNPNDTNNFLLSLGTGLRDTFGTKEGLENLFMGALVGGLIHGGKGLIEKVQGIDNKRKSLINSATAWLNGDTLTGMFRNTYDEAVSSDSIAKDMQDAARSGNVFDYKNLQHEQLFNFVDSGIKSNRFDLRIDQLNMLKEMGQKEFEEMFKLPYTDQNRRNASDYVDSVISKALDIKSNIDKVNELFPNPFDARAKKNPDEVRNHFIFEDYKSQLGLDLSSLKDNQRRLGQVSEDISKIAPLADQDKLRQLTSERGIQETIEDFNQRITDLDKSKELYSDNKSSKEYKAYQKEKDFLKAKTGELTKQLENYDPVTYNKTAEDIINYHLNNGVDFKNKISPIDVKDVLGKSQDSFKLINSGDRALYHYQHLVSKEGFDDYVQRVKEAYDNAGQDFEKSDIGKRLLGTKVEPAPVIKSEPKTDEAVVDNKGRIVTTPKEPVPPTAEKAEAKKQEIEAARKTELQQATEPQLPTELKGAKPNYNFGDKAYELQFASDVDKAAYIAAQEKKSKRDSDYVDFVKKNTGMSEQEVRDYGKQVRAYIKQQAKEGEGGTLDIPKIKDFNKPANTEKVNEAHNNKYVEAVSKGDMTADQAKQALGDKINPQLETALDNAEAERTGDFSKVLSFTGELSDEEVSPFEVEETNPEVKEKEQKASEIKGQPSPLFQNLPPLNNYNKIYQPDKVGLPYTHNLRDAVFSQSDKELYNKLTLSVKESTEGMKYEDKRPVPGFKNLYYRGNKHDIEILADGKSVGFVQSPDRHLFKRGDEFLPISEITPGEYGDVTRNAEATYDDFVKEVRDHKGIVDKILTDFKDGKTSYTNEEFKKLFDTIVNYGTGDYSDRETTSTKIKDLKYKSNGDAVLSVPSIYDKEAKEVVRTKEPVILNEKDLSETDFQKLNKFIESNIGDIHKLNSRYFYIFKMPNGEYEKASIAAARPAQQSPEVLDNLVTVINSITPESKIGDIRKANVALKDALYIASSKDFKGNKTQLSLEFNDKGGLYLKVINSATNFRKAYLIDTEGLRNFDDLVNKLNNKIAEKWNDDKLSKLKIRLNREDFKNAILPDEQTSMKELEDKLKVSVQPNPFKNYKLFVVPKREGEAVPVELNPQEQAVYDAVKNNLDKVSPVYKTGIEQALNNPRRLVDTVISQANDNPNSIEKFFGKPAQKEILPLLNARIATDKKSLTAVMKETFGLKDKEAKAVAEIYDRTAEAWAKRNNSTKEEFYKTLTFKKGGTLPEGAFKQEEITQINKEIEEIRTKAEKDGTLFRAPNGKISNLSAQQWFITRTPTFKKWFGESKAVDENGDPQVFWHGTTKRWYIYNKKEGNRQVGLFLTPEPDFAEDYTKTTNDKIKEPILMPLFVKADKPFDYDNKKDLDKLTEYDKIIANKLKEQNESDEIKQKLSLSPHTFLKSDSQNWSILENSYFQKFLTKNGYDGYYVKEQGIKNLAVYEPEQVKDASGANTTFNPKDPNILFQENMPNEDELRQAFDYIQGIERPEKATNQQLDYLVKKLNISKRIAANALFTEWNDYVAFKKEFATRHNDIIRGGEILNQKAKGAALIAETGKATIYALTNPDVSTPLHELAHVWEPQLTDSERRAVLGWTKQEAWTKDTSERFARGFEKYLADGEAPTTGLQKLFDQFKQWLVDIYKGIAGSDIDLTLNEPMKKIYAAMLGEDYAEKIKEEVKAESEKSVKFSWDTLPKQSKEILKEKLEEVKTDINHAEGLDKEDLIKKKEALQKAITAQNPPKTKTAKERVNDQFAEALNNVLQKERWATPIPADSPNYWGHLSDIQLAFVNHRFDDLISKGDITESELRNIVNSTKTKENGGLPQNLVDDVMFRVGNQDLINSIDYWQSKPKVEDKGYVNYVKTIREVLRNGQFVDAVNKELIDPKESQAILEAAGIENKTASDAIKAKIKASEKTDEQIKEADTKAEDEPTEKPQEAPEPKPTEQYEKDEPVLYKGKQYTVSDVTQTASGAKLYTISDGTKYGDKAVYPESLEKVNKQTFTDPEMLKEVTPVKYNDLDKELVDEQDKELYNFVGLKTLMERLRDKFDIPYKIVEGDKSWKGRIVDGTVFINGKNYDNTTPFHEYLHPFIAVLKVDNPNLYRNLVEEFGKNPYGKDLINEVKNNAFYKDKNAQEIGDEALVRYISKAASENVNSEGRRIRNKFYAAMKSLIDRFRDWLSGALKNLGFKGGAMVAQMKGIPENASLQDVADLVSLHDMKFNMSGQSDLINALDLSQKEASKTLSDEDRIMRKLSHNLRILEDTAKRRLPSEELLSNVISVKAILRDADQLGSLDRFLSTGISALQYANDEFKRVTGKIKSPETPLTPEDITDLSRSMGVIKNLIAFYKDDVDYLLKGAAKGMDKDEYFEYLKVIHNTDNVIASIKNRTVDILTEWMYPTFEEAHRLNTKYPEFKLTKEEFRNQLYAASSDTDGLAFAFGAISTSKDPVNATAHAMIKSLYEDSYLDYAKTDTAIKLGYNDFLSDKKISNDKVHTTDYYKNNYLRKASILQKVGEDFEGKPQYDYKSYWAYHEKYLYDLYDKARTDFMEGMKFDPQNQQHIDQLIEWENQNTRKEGDESFPHDKYLNPEFEKLYNKDPFFTLLYNLHQEANNKLGEQERLKYGMIPQVSKGKNMFADYKWNEPVQAAKTFAGKVVNFFLPKDEQQVRINEQAKQLNLEKQAKLKEVEQEGLTPDEFNRKNQQLEDYYTERISKLSGSDDVAKNLDGSYYRNIKAPFIRPLADEDLDMTLPDTLLKFHDAVNKTTSLRDAEPNVALLRSIIESSSEFIPEVRKVLKSTSKGNMIFDRIANLPADKPQIAKRLNRQLQHFLQTTVYNDIKDKATLDIFGLRQIDLNKFGDNMAFMTSAMTMAGNVTASLAHATIVGVNAFSEGLGGKFWKPNDWAFAAKEYIKNLPEFMADLSRLKKSFWTQFGIKHDIIQGDFRDNWGKKITGSMMQRFANGRSLFFLTHGIVHEMQMQAAMSLAHNTPVKLKSGEITNYIGAHELNKDGYLRTKKDAIWTPEDDKAFTSRINGITQYLNGIYNPFDKVYAQRKWYGRAALIFRKHFYSALKARWGKPYFDVQIQDRMGGIYRDFFGKLASDIKEYKTGAITKFFTKEGWNDDEKYAWNRSVFELGLFATTIIVGTAIARGESTDKDKSWGQQYLNLMMLRLRANLGQYNVLGAVDVVNMLKNPSASLGILTKVGDFMGQLVVDPFAQYKEKSGYFNQGDSELFAKFSKLIPFYNQWIKLKTPDEQAKFYQFIQK